MSQSIDNGVQEVSKREDLLQQIGLQNRPAQAEPWLRQLQKFNDVTDFLGLDDELLELLIADLK